MKEIKNLLIVNSPLILLNALEAISYFKLKNILIVAIYNRSINNEKQIETILEKLNVEEIIRVHFGNSSKFTKYIELIKELQKNEYACIPYVLVGQLLGYFKSENLGLNPDEPSVSGNISRVVEGVKIYDL